MKVLVTGGAGFIGSHIQDRLIELGHEVAILDNLSTGKKENINEKSTHFSVDIKDPEAVEKAFQDFKPEVVFHLAAQADVPTSIKDPHFDLLTNIGGTLNILLAAKNAMTRRIVYTNTGGALYGELDEKFYPVKENQVVDRPSSFYGTSKFCAEQYVKLFGNLYGMEWIALRYANVYGPRQEGNKEAGVVAIFTTKLLNGETPTINGDGKYIRDYVFVGDVVEANMKALDYSDSDYFNIGAGNSIDTWQVFEQIEKNLNTGIKPSTGPARVGDARKFTANISKAKEKLGWEPKVDFETGIKMTIEYYKKQN